MKIKLKIWRQKNGNSKGRLVSYNVDDVSEHMSFLELLDVLNEDLIKTGREPVAFGHDCREGICGSCGLMIDGRAHGPEKGTTVCQLHMRSFQDGATIVVEPWRALAFPIIKDLVVDRRGFDRILHKGGYISVNTGAAPDANAIPISKKNADEAFQAAACIGCGACVASCKNASAMLFVSAKVSHLALLPQGNPERKNRALAMVNEMDQLKFGHCTNAGSCEVECPKEISVKNIARLNREYLSAAVTQETV